jgi:predicted metal-binding protein
MFEIFKGIKIYMYDFDHNPPHFHSIYAEYEVLRDIRDLSVLRGEMPANKLKQIIKWAKLNQQFLLEEFEALNQKLRK